MARTPHASLNRPLVAPLRGGLPPGAIPYGTNSAWPNILLTLERHRGLWHSLERTYAHPSNAVSLARKWAETMFDAATCERLEAAWMHEGSKVRVFLRFRAEGQRPFTAPEEDEEVAEEDEPEAEEVAPEPSAYKVEHEYVDEPLPEDLLPPEETAEVATDEAGEAAAPEAGFGRSFEPRTRLSPSEIRDVRKRRDAGESVRKLANEYGVAQSTISRYASRR